MTKKNKRLLWISPLILDKDFHKTTQIEILRGLTTIGYDAFLVSSYSLKKPPTNESSVQMLSFPIRYFRLFSTSVYVAFLFLFLPFLLLKHKPNIVVVEPLTALHGAEVKLFSKLLKINVVLDIRSGPVGKYGLSIGLFFQLAISLAKKLFDGLTTITPLSKELLSKRFRIRNDFIGVWTSGVSTKLFFPQPKIGDELKRNLGLGGKFVVFYHGSFGSPATPRGLVETIEAIGLIGKKYPEVILFLLGSGPLNLANIVNLLGIKDRVVIHNPVDYREVPKYVAMCDVGIVPLPDQPYWWHQSPLNLLEYMAMGKMVIASNIPANRTILKDSKCGVYTSIDPDKIAKSIIAVYDQRYNASQLGGLGRTIVENEYSWEVVSRNFDNYLSKLPFSKN